jgi:hypothetical protein
MHTELYNIYIYTHTHTHTQTHTHNTPLFFSELFNAGINFVKEKIRCMLMVTILLWRNIRPVGFWEFRVNELCQELNYYSRLQCNKAGGNSVFIDTNLDQY